MFIIPPQQNGVFTYNQYNKNTLQTISFTASLMPRILQRTNSSREKELNHARGRRGVPWTESPIQQELVCCSCRLKTLSCWQPGNTINKRLFITISRCYLRHEIRLTTSNIRDTHILANQHNCNVFSCSELLKCIFNCFHSCFYEMS